LPAARPKAAEGLAAIAAVVEEVGLLLNQHAALVAGQQAHGEMIRESASRDPDRSLLAKGGGHGLFELGDYSTDGVFVGLDRSGEFLEQRGVLRRSMVDTVAVGLDTGGASSSGGFASCGGAKWGGKECAAVHLRPRVACSEVEVAGSNRRNAPWRSAARIGEDKVGV